MNTTPVSFTFKNQEKSKTTTEYGVADIQYLELTGIEAYQRYTGPITMNPVDLQRHTYLNTATREAETVFLKVHVDGSNVKLLSYTDQLKTRYFIQEKGEAQPQELYYNRSFAPGSESQIAEQKGYVGQLQFLANSLNTNSPKLQRAIASAHYEASDLEKIALTLNNNSKETSSVKALKPATRFFLGPGLNQNIIKVTLYDGLENADSNKGAVTPRLALGFDVFRNKHIQRYYLRMELAATTADYHIENRLSSRFGYYNTYDYKVKQRSISISPQLIYTLFNTESIKVYVGAAVSMNLSNYPENIHRIESYYNDGASRAEPSVNDIALPLKKLWHSYGFRTGLILGKRVEITAMYNPPMLVSEFVLTRIKQQSLSVGMNYLFQ